MSLPTIAVETFSKFPNGAPSRLPVDCAEPLRPCRPTPSIASRSDTVNRSKVGAENFDEASLDESPSQR